MTGSSAYHKTGGSLKLKGGPAIGPSNQSKTKSSSSKKKREKELSGANTSASDGRDQQRDKSPSATTSATGNSNQHNDGKTEAQRKFEEVQRKRLLEKAAKAATKTHKDRVAEFNTKLENMSEHYDLPRIGPG